jgi:hypothetical protein
MAESRPVDSFGTDRRMWVFVGRGLALGLLVGIALALLDRVIGADQPVVLALGAPAAVGMIVQLVRLGVVDVQPSARVTTPDPGVSEYFVRLRQLERRLETAATDPDDYDWAIRPMLVQLAADRLLYRHGIRYQIQPVRAREIVGDELWEIMTQPLRQPSRPVSRQRLTALVEQIEQL